MDFSLDLAQEQLSGWVPCIMGYPSIAGSEIKAASLDYQRVYNEIAKLLEDEDYDDGSYGPILVRLAWHASGTFDRASGNGGSGGATMRYQEANHGANAGLQVARNLLEPIKKKFPDITYADLWTLAGVVAIQEMGGPTILWRPGRSDDKPESDRPPEGRLPDASKDENHIRQVFTRMGFNDQEAVALIGAHALGRCHPDRSGFEGPWTFSPIVFTNDYFVKLLEEKWVPRKWSGPHQFADEGSKSLMMLPTDMALIKDATYKKFVELYAKDAAKFSSDFAAAFAKLLELGNHFDPQSSPLAFKPSAE
ncbi:heme peroxidase [Entomophthora muscae]|uniref:Heme peroxidase n=1 Tax=Entomophthora muscae TaxID=34485 RepID=A0ACC2TAK7_9FUNG|nr:heme peroxidase [Entomophthora muscae]